MRRSRGSPGAEPSVTTPQRARQRLMEVKDGAPSHVATSGRSSEPARAQRGSPMAHVRPAEATVCPCEAVVACDQRHPVSACPGIGRQQELHTGVKG
jgi:hypothetical protein